MINHGSFCVLGVNIHAVDYAYAVDRIVSNARDGRAYGVSALAVHGVMTGALDQEHAVRLNALDLVVPDGQPVRWALRWLHGIRLNDRVYGPSLALYAAGALAAAGMPVYLYGSTDTVLSSLSQNLQKRFPALQIAGMEASRFAQVAPDEQQQIARRIRDSGARAVFVGLGCPRQEVWIYEHKQLLNMPTLAVGAAFDFLAGLLPQAPPLLQRHGLEWAYRLYLEPRRLWRRYLLLNPLYLWGLFRQKMGWDTNPESGSSTVAPYKGFA
jgi:N-acetylglucosaminyldiphosphoundecaprenol N-acetyl-beta-D-mannosaminyltransferase